jgi:hypothetical protein
MAAFGCNHRSRLRCSLVGQRPLLTVRLRGGNVHLPFSMAELLVAREGQSDDPKVQRHLSVNFMQSVGRDWRHALRTISPRGSIGDPPTDVPCIVVKAPLAISLPTSR